MYEVQLLLSIYEKVTELLKIGALIFTSRYMKRLGGVMLFNVIYIVGLVVLYVFERSETRKTSNLIVATLLISLGKTGFIVLISFIGDQLREPAKEVKIEASEKSNEEDLIVRLTMAWWVLPWGLSACIAPFFRLSITTSIILLTSLLGVALGILRAGDYHGAYKDRKDSDNDENHEHQDEASVKAILKIILVWISLILYTIVAAAGTTFFLQQAYMINSDFPVVTFLIFKHIANIFISVRLSNGGNNLFTQLAAGMLLAFLSSVLAFGIAFRTDADNRGGIWLLTPQYVLLGAAEGLARDAFEGYFRDRIQRIVHIVHKKKVKYGIMFFMGFGKFLSYVMLTLALGFSVLDADDLKLYYKLLMGASSASLLVSLYLRFNEDPILPKGLTSDVFIQSGGQMPITDPKGESPKSPRTVPNTHASHG